MTYDNKERFYIHMILPKIQIINNSKADINKIPHF